jgi:predicted outer membrane repeat protein
MAMRVKILYLFLYVSVLSVAQRTYYVRPGGSDTNCGFSEDDAWATVVHAIIRAPGGSVINIAGVFTEDSVSLPSQKQLTIDGTSRDGAVIRGAALKNTGGTRYFLRLQPGDDITFRNVTIMNFGSSGSGLNGGAIMAKGPGTRLTCKQVDFIGNTAVAGGAVYALGTAATFEDCNFIDNYASGGQGGAVYALTTAAEKEMSLVVRRCAFLGNVSLVEGSAVRAGCGAVSTIKTSVLIENSTVSNNINGINTNVQGNFASVFLDGNAVYPTADFCLKNNTIAYNRRNSANTSQQSYTTGVYVNNNRNVSLINNIIWGNDNCDLQQRTTADYKVFLANNNLLGTVKLRTSVASAGTVEDMSVTARNNRTGVTAGQLLLAPRVVISEGCNVLPVASGSIAIDAGSADTSAVTTDQRGVARDAKIDIGACEFGNLSLDVSDAGIDAVAAYPTVFTDVIHFNGQEVKSVELYDCTGQQVKVCANVGKSLSLAALPVGFYVMKVYAGNRLVAVQKIVKQ